MGRISEQENGYKQEVLKMTWEYIRDNFHKFNEANKIKIAISLMTKDIPQKVEGELKVTTMPDIRYGLAPLEFDVG